MSKLWRILISFDLGGWLICMMKLVGFGDSKRGSKSNIYLRLRSHWECSLISPIRNIRRQFIFHKSIWLILQERGFTRIKKKKHKKTEVPNLGDRKNYRKIFISLSEDQEVSWTSLHKIKIEWGFCWTKFEPLQAFLQLHHKLISNLIRKHFIWVHNHNKKNNFYLT